MPTNRTLRPDNFSSAFGWANSNVIYDNNTASYMTGTGSNMSTTFSLADLTVTPEMSIVALTMNVMWEVVNIVESNFYIEVSNPTEGWSVTKKMDDYSTSTGYTSQIDLVALRQNAPAGKRTWTPNSWNGTQIRLYTGSNSNQINVREVWFTIQTNDQPKVASSGPNTTVALLRPTFTFAVTDADGDTISKYRMLVYNVNELVRVQQNLSAADIKAEFDSGEIAYGGPAGTISVPVTTDLRTGQAYRAFLMTWDSAGVMNNTTYVNTIYSYANIEVPLLAVPQRPSVIADDTNAKMDIALQAEDNILTFNASGAELNTTADAGQSLNAGGLVTSTENPLEGSYAFRTTHSTTGNMDVIFTGTTIPVGLLTKVSGSLSCRFRTNQRTFQVGIAFYDAAGSYISTALGQTYQQRANNAWTHGVIQDVTVPALAARASLVGHINGGAASESHEWDALTVQPRRFINVFRSPLLNRNSFTGSTQQFSKYLSGSWNPGSETLTASIEAIPDGIFSEGVGQRFTSTAGSNNRGWWFAGDFVNGRTYTISVWVYFTAAVNLKWNINTSGGFNGDEGSGATNLSTTAVPANTWTLVKASYTHSAASGLANVYLLTNTNVAFNSYETLLQFVDTTGLTLADYNPATTYMPNGWTRGGGLSTQRLTLQRRRVGGTTWYTVKTFVTGQANTVRLEDVDLNDATQSAQVQDYFVQPGVGWEYRTRVTGTDASGLSISSPWSQVFSSAQLTTLRQTGNTKAWLKSPTDPSKNIKFEFQSWKISKTIQKQRAVKMPIGRKHPVIVSGQRRSESFDWGVLCLASSGLRDKLVALLDGDESLVLQLPKRQMLVNIPDDYKEDEWESKNGADPDDVVVSGVFQEVSGDSKL